MFSPSPKQGGRLANISFNYLSEGGGDNEYMPNTNAPKPYP